MDKSKAFTMWIGGLVMILVHLESAQSHSRLPVTNGTACCPGNNILTKLGCLDYTLNSMLVNAPKNETTDGKKRKVRMLCDNGMYLMEPMEDKMSIQNDGTLLIEENIEIEEGKYCIADKIDINDTVDLKTLEPNKMEQTQVVLVCFTQVEIKETFLAAAVSGTLAFISVSFLILTLLVYAIVPELRDLQGKCMMCTSASLCLGFFHLALAQLSLVGNDISCLANGFMIYFWMMSAFFWMNIVSINVMKSVVFRNALISEKNTFLIYKLYGCGCPLLFLIAALAAEFTDGSHLKPGFGRRSCWFAGRIETWSYFYGPVALLIVCNIVLFIVTSVKLWNQTHYENVTKIRSMKYKFLLYLKIFLVMGLTWIFEIISFVHDTGHIVWLIIDTFNSLQGLVFFLVLILFRKRALRGLAAKGLRMPCAPNAHTGADNECDEIIPEEEAPALATLS